MIAKYEFIDAQEETYPIVKMCAWLQVSRSNFYEWRVRPESATAKRRQELAILITEAFTDSDRTYGYRRVHAQLIRWGVQVSRELVRILMRDMDLQPCQPRPWRPVTTIGQASPSVPDLVRRDFTATEPGTKLIGDITYVRTWVGFLYLATVIDCCTKECVGYAMADHMRAELVVAALDMAGRNGRICAGAVFHSDRGSQYASADFAATAEKWQIQRSMGRTGVCFDNAAAESFNGTVKVERVNRTEYPTHEHARKDITRYIEFRYNTRRLHSALGYRTPFEVYNEYVRTHAAA